MIKGYKQYISEASSKPLAIWVIGGAAAGKSTIAEKSIVKDLGFILIDVDKPFEELIKRFNLSPDIKAQTPEQKAAAKIRKQKKDALIKAGKLQPPPKMKELKDPEDYFKGRPLTSNAAGVVAREKTARLRTSSLVNKKNLVFVETGGQTGRIMNEKKRMEADGYSTFVVFVAPFVKLDLSKQANFNKVFKIVLSRGQGRRAAGGRGLDPKILERSLTASIEVKKKLLPKFGKDVLLIDTSESKNIKKNQSLVTKTIRTWMSKHK